MLQDADGITKLICKLDTKQNHLLIHFHSNRTLVVDAASQPSVCYYRLLVKNVSTLCHLEFPVL